MERVIVAGICVGLPGLGPAKERVPTVEVAPGGLAGDRHAGEVWVTRSDGKERFNERQWSGVSDEEVALIEQRLGIRIPIGALGENFRLAGVPALTHLPCGTMLRFPSGAVLGVAGENQPCLRMAYYLSELTGVESVRRQFVKAATGLRGVVGWVEAPGVVTEGETVVVQVPDNVAEVTRL